MGVDGHKKEEEGDKAVGHYCSSMSQSMKEAKHADQISFDIF